MYICFIERCLCCFFFTIILNEYFHHHRYLLFPFGLRPPSLHPPITPGVSLPFLYSMCIEVSYWELHLTTYSAVCLKVFSLPTFTPELPLWYWLCIFVLHYVPDTIFFDIVISLVTGAKSISFCSTLNVRLRPSCQ